MARHEPVAIEVDPKQISKILFSETGHNTIFDVEVTGQAAAKAMIVDWQREPLNDKLIHIDLKRIALDKALRVFVRVKLLGIPFSVRTSGGILDQVLREVEIKCLPGRHSQPHRCGCQQFGDARRVARWRPSITLGTGVASCSVTSTFDGFRSRWITPFWCAC